MLGRELLFEEKEVGHRNEIKLNENLEQLQTKIIFYQIKVGESIYTGKLVKY